jgi:uncharacterized protein YdbL (DUF1318 family)
MNLGKVVHINLIQDISSKINYVRTYKPILKENECSKEKITTLTGKTLDNEIKYWSYLTELDKFNAKPSAFKLNTPARRFR